MNDTVLLMKSMITAMGFYILVLYEIALESKAEIILEIGTGRAQSTRAFLSALEENKQGVVIAVDNRDRSNRIPDFLKEYFVQIIGDSHKTETLDRVQTKIGNNKCDILLIDGDHTYEGVKKDFGMYEPLVKEQGFIFLHDIDNRDAGVGRFWEEINYPKIPFHYGATMKGKFSVGMGLVYKKA